MNNTTIAIQTENDPWVSLDMPRAQAQLILDLMKVVLANRDRITPEQATAADLIIDRIAANMA